MKYFRPKAIPLVVQLMHLQRRLTGSGEIRRSRLVWRQHIQPHSLAHTYKCRLEHTLGEFPRVYCLEPKLSLLAGERKLPHVRTQTEPIELCLFMHRMECWTDDMLLAEITIPLASYWLAHFEEWLFSGHWRGGGTHEIAVEPPLVAPEFPCDVTSAALSAAPSQPAEAA